MNVQTRLDLIRFRLREITAFKIAMLYVLVSGAWVALSDRLLWVLVRDESLYMQLQTGKGWIFVGLSALLLYGMVVYRERQLQRANTRLGQAVQQVSILHRVLRHNLRNVLNVIYGNVEMLDSLTDQERLALIKDRLQRLIDLSEKSDYLHNVAMGDRVDPEPTDIEEVVRGIVDEIRARHPAATIHTTFGNVGEANVLPRFDIVVNELVENAIEHNDREEPTVWISLEQEVGGTIRLDIADDGPGIPEMEEEVIERGVETPMFHSMGLGLWLARIMVTESAGDVTIVDNEPRGSVVRLELLPSDDESRLA